MRSKSWVAVIFFMVFVFQLIDIQAQIIKKNISISWKENLIYKLDEENTL